MSFFTQDYLDFFAELELNNNKEWFDENRKRYEKSVKEPFKAFVDELILRFTNEVDRDVVMTSKEAIFRINRDIRFSKDKQPYKTHHSAVVSRYGRKEMAHPGLYLQLNHNDIRVYSGMYGLDKNQLYRVREEIIEHKDEFLELVSNKDFVEVFEEIRGEKNKVLPKEFKEYVDDIPLLLNKTFYYFFKQDPTSIFDEDIFDQIIQKYKTALPLNNFFERALSNDFE